jgi:predicted HTH transcriptional regulator
VFRSIVPLDDSYSFDAEIDKAQNKVQDKGQDKGQIKGKACTISCTLSENAVLEYLQANPRATQSDAAAAIGKSLRSVKSDIAALKAKGLLEHEGARKNGHWKTTAAKAAKPS